MFSFCNFNHDDEIFICLLAKVGKKCCLGEFSFLTLAKKEDFHACN